MTPLTVTALSSVAREPVLDLADDLVHLVAEQVETRDLTQPNAAALATAVAALVDDRAVAQLPPVVVARVLGRWHRRVVAELAAERIAPDRVAQAIAAVLARLGHAVPLVAGDDPAVTAAAPRKRGVRPARPAAPRPDEVAGAGRVARSRVTLWWRQPQ